MDGTCWHQSEDNTVRVVTNLLGSQYEENQAKGAAQVEQLCRQDIDLVLRAQWLPHLVAMLEALQEPTRAAAAAAMAVMAVDTNGRDALRRSGALKPLNMLLAEGPASLAAQRASLALMNVAVDDMCKDAIRDAGGIRFLIRVIEQYGQEAAAALEETAEDDEEQPVVARDMSCSRQTAEQASGALVNLVLNDANRKMLSQPECVHPLQHAADHGRGVLSQRCNFVLSWIDLDIKQSDLLGKDTKDTKATLTDKLLMNLHVIGGKPQAPQPQNTHKSALKVTSNQPFDAERTNWDVQAI